MDAPVDLDGEALVRDVEFGLPSRERNDVALLKEMLHLRHAIFGNEEPLVRIDAPLGSADGLERLRIFDLGVFGGAGRDVADFFLVRDAAHRFGEVLEDAALFRLQEPSGEIMDARAVAFQVAAPVPEFLQMCFVRFKISRLRQRDGEAVFHKSPAVQLAEVDRQAFLCRSVERAGQVGRSSKSVRHGERLGGEGALREGPFLFFEE